MSKTKLLVIAPYSGLDEIIMNLIEGRDDVTAECYVANLHEAIPLLEKLDVYNYDCIISRGGTATLIDSIVNVPVYDVGLSGLDVLRAVRLAQNFSQNIGIIGYDRITKNMYQLSEILEWNYPIVTITSSEEAEPELQKFREMGISVIVCDVISTAIAPNLGMNAVLVTSGYETVENILNQAIRLTQGYLHNRQELTHLTLAFQNSPYGCTILDTKGNVIQSRYQLNDPDRLLPFIKDHALEIIAASESEFERPYRGGTVSFVLQKRFVQNEQYTYLYARFHERPETRKIDAITQRSAVEENTQNLAYYNSSHYQTNTQDQIERYARSLSPVIIYGEPGTGKDQAAYFLYCKSTYQSSLYYQIDCETATDKNWHYLFTHHDSILMHNKHTIYFRHVNRLPQNIFHRLLATISDTNLEHRNRLIFSFVSEGTSTETNYLHNLLQTMTMNSLTLRLPALRERPDDIPFLCTLYINRLNAKLGKQIIGFDAKAMRAMKTYMWESNLDQFKRIIEELMLVTTTSYISYEATMRQLSQESALWKKDVQHGFQFNLDQPLADINYDIIRQVLKEENNNHSRTAERLGIGRSTLWRMLKSR